MGNAECCTNDPAAEKLATELAYAPADATIEGVVPDDTVEAMPMELTPQTARVNQDPQLCKVTLTRKDNSDKFGFINATRKDNKPVLVITKISPDGLLAQWNKAHGFQVVNLSEIVSVNGISGDVPLMRDQLRTSNELMMEVTTTSTSGSAQLK
mmetsp:Transcript_43771/g.98392  ORF Transcript_43771/g.98392 Transcript_43771/m.98392 type:complete len:154 (-) Transcript_43771:136-597(-)